MCNLLKRKHPLISHKTQVHLYVQYYTLKSNAYLRSILCAKMSTTCSALISLSLYTLRSPSPDKRSVPIVLRKYVLTLRIVENDLSAVAVETGITKSSMKHFLMLGYSCSLAKAMLSSSVSAGSNLPIAHLKLVAIMHRDAGLT